MRAEFVLLLVLLVLLSGCDDENATMVTITGRVAVPAAVPYVPGNSSLLAGNGQANGAQGLAVGVSPRYSRVMCDPFPCKSVPHTPVRIVSSNPKGWTAVPVEPTTTDANGDYSITVDADVLNSGGPYFVMALDPSGEYPLMATIPPDLIYAGTIHLSIDRTTTAAAVMHCPGGTSTLGPLQSHGGYCWSDPQESVHVEHLEATIDLYFADNPSLSVDPEDYLPDVSEDPDVQDDMNQILPEDVQPEGFKPIGISGASHLLEGLGQIYWGAETTLPQPKPTYPPQTNPPYTNPPHTNPPKPNPSGFPNLPEDGVYDISVRVCTQYANQQTCYDGGEQYTGQFNVNDIVDALNAAAAGCRSQGASCSVSYSPYNGRSFTATLVARSCYGGSCASSTTYYTITRVG